MAVFTQAELEAALAGVVDDLTTAEYAVAEAFARSKLMAYLGTQFSEEFESDEVVRKQIGLELGYCRAVWMRFSEERDPQSNTTERFEFAMKDLNAFAKHALHADADSVESTRQVVSVSGLKESDGTDVTPSFTEAIMSKW